MNNIVVWENTEKIRKLFAPTLSADELSFFMALGKNLGANPFTREIWAVKYDRNQPAAIFCGRDFYRRIAQEQADYEGHNVQAVYSNDLIEIENGEVKRHIPNLREPGELIGAYCILWRAGKKPFFHIVRFREYYKGLSNWKSMPETMLKKVAEAQTLRMAFQGIFRGTYDESEDWTETENKSEITSLQPCSSLELAVSDTVNPIKADPQNTSLDKTSGEETRIPAAVTIQQIAEKVSPELKEMFSRRRMSTGKIIEVWNRHQGDQKSIITEMTERKAA